MAWKIAHFGPYAPIRCGLYEAARDMVRADLLAGHESIFVDVGIPSTNEPARVGVKDDRAGFVLETHGYQDAFDSDVFVFHAGAPDNWVVRSCAPIIFVLHGRPLMTFRPEQYEGGMKSYSLLADLARWPRIRAMLSFWPEFVPYWDVIVPPEKLVTFDAPPIDTARFSDDGPRANWGNKRGKWNILIADSWREDIDCYEVVHGALEAAKRIEGLKIQFYAIENKGGVVPDCWSRIFDKARDLGALGDICGRRPDIAEAYRAADLLLTPHRIAVRTMVECLCCGTPVVAGRGCTFTPYTAAMDDPVEIAEAIGRCINALENEPESVADVVAKAASRVLLSEHNERMGTLYDRVIEGAA